MNNEDVTTEEEQQQPSQPLWIKHYSLTNIRAVEFEEMEVGKVQVFTGGEGTGKTSRIEGIIAALTPGEHRPALVREGAPEGSVAIQLTDGTEVLRTYTLDGGAPRAKVSRGKFRPTAVQQFLDEYFGVNTFDPIGFMDLTGKEQTQEFMEYMPVELSDEKIDELADHWGWTDDPVAELIDRKGHPLAILRQLAEALYEKRLDVGRLKTTHQETAFGIFQDDLPEGFDAEAAEAASSEALSAELAEARTHNTEIRNAEQRLKFAQQGHADSEQKIAALQKAKEESEAHYQEVLAQEIKRREEEIAQEIARHEQEIANLREALTVDTASRGRTLLIDIDTRGKAITEEEVRLGELTECEEEVTAWLAENEPLPSAQIENLQQQLSGHDKVKEQLGIWRSGEEHKEKAAEQEVIYQHLTSLLAGVRLMPGVLLSKIKIPIEGLAFNTEEGWFEINERPLDALSDGERLRLALDVARMTMGKLKALFIDKAEGLDPERWAQLLEVARTDDIQYFISKVGEGELRVECYDRQEE